MITYSSNRVGSALSILWAIPFVSDVRDKNARTALRTTYHYHETHVKKEQKIKLFTNYCYQKESDHLKALITQT